MGHAKLLSGEFSGNLSQGAPQATPKSSDAISFHQKC